MGIDWTKEELSTPSKMKEYEEFAVRILSDMNTVEKAYSILQEANKGTNNFRVNIGNLSYDKSTKDSSPFMHATLAKGAGFYTDIYAYMSGLSNLGVDIEHKDSSKKDIAKIAYLYNLEKQEISKFKCMTTEELEQIHKDTINEER